MTTEDEIRAARRTVAIHRRRRYPDTTVCGLCGYRWLSAPTAAGKTVTGCLRRRRALDILESAGRLDGQGRLN